LAMEALSPRRGAWDIMSTLSRMLSAGDGLSKEQVLNDVTNSGVMAALVGGFALSNMQSDSWDHAGSHMDPITYLLLK
jgi:hypothetical protein